MSKIVSSCIQHKHADGSYSYESLPQALTVKKNKSHSFHHKTIAWAVQQVNDGVPKAQVAREVNCSKTSIYNWVKKFS